MLVHTFRISDSILETKPFINQKAMQVLDIVLYFPWKITICVEPILRKQNQNDTEANKNSVADSKSLIIHLERWQS